MKNVLLTTTVLVAIAGTASAGSHTGIAWAGSAGMDYNSLGGFSYDAGVTVTGTADLNNGVTATMSYGIALDGAGAITGDVYPVITLESGMGKLSAGDGDAVGGASDHFSDHGATELSSYTTTDFAIRADVAYGGFNFSVSEVVIGAADLQVGASGSVSGFDLGLGYDGTGAIGISVDTMMAGFDLGVGYNAGDSSWGVDAGYAVSAAIGVSASYASTGDWSVGAAYASGAITADVSYDSAGVILVDGTYDLGSGLVAGAGYDSGAAGGYVAATLDLGSDASAFASYSSAVDLGPEEYAEGITIGVSMSF